MITVPEDTVFWALRYALGRRSYVVSEVIAAIRIVRPQLSDKMIQMICREIKIADSLGDPCDESAWRALAAELEGGANA